MRLPDRIEHEIVALEQHIASETKQMAGPPRLRGLRSAIENFMREARVDYTGKRGPDGPGWKDSL